MSIFSGLSSAMPGGGNRNYLKSIKAPDGSEQKGQYLLYTERCFTHRSVQSSDTFFIGEYAVIKSNVPEHPPGSEVSQGFKINKFTLGDIRANIAGLFGCDISQVNEQSADIVTSAQNPARGKFVLVSVGTRITKKQPDGRGGKTITVCDWKPVPPDVAASLQAEAAPLIAAAAAKRAERAARMQSSAQQPQQQAFGAFGAPAQPQQAFGVPPATPPAGAPLVGGLPWSFQ